MAAGRRAHAAGLPRIGAEEAVQERRGAPPDPHVIPASLDPPDAHAYAARGILGMAVIRVAGRAVPVPSSSVRSLLVSLQREGVAIDVVCGGRAMCGRCAVRILAGCEHLAPPRPRELERLRALGVGDDVRLACQTHARGDVEIQILNPRPAASGPRSGPGTREEP